MLSSRCAVPACWLGLWLGLLLLSSALGAEPYVPTTVPTTPTTALLTVPAAVNTYWQQQASTQTELSIAERLQQAQQLLRTAQQGENPDGYGQAEALLLPLTNTHPLPTQAAYLLAYIKQHNHEFAAALALLNDVLQQQPRHAAALLQRAQIQLVLADYAAAISDCNALQGLVSAALHSSCLAQAWALSGKLQQATALVNLQLTKLSNANSSDWYELQLTSATLAEQRGNTEAATVSYQALLAQAPHDRFVTQHLADLYLRSQQADKALALLEPQQSQPKSLELEVTLLQALRDAGKHSDAQALQQTLAAKFALAETRSLEEQPHKELALFALLQGDVNKALQAAQRNWKAQKEPSDLLLLAEAAAAAKHLDTLTSVKTWLSTTGLQDQRIEQVLQGYQP
jgi:predicted Zn-dependent protease